MSSEYGSEVLCSHSTALFFNILEVYILFLYGTISFFAYSKQTCVHSVVGRYLYI